MFWSNVNTTDRTESSIPVTPSAGLVETRDGAGNDTGSGSEFPPHETARTLHTINTQRTFFMVFV
jgi:hypothetical protein